MTLTEFLLARIAEDEAVANFANSGVRWESWNRSWDTEPRRDIAAGGVRVFTVPTMYDEHVARFDPVRVLAECEAKRRIVDEHPLDEDGYCYDSHSHMRGCKWLWPCLTLRALAAVYADHPEYQSGWGID